MRGVWCSRLVRDSCDVGVWKASDGGLLKAKLASMWAMTKELNSRKIWCGEYSLELSFLELFSIAVAKDPWVAEMREQKGKGGH